MDRYDGDQLLEALGLKIRSGASLDELERCSTYYYKNCKEPLEAKTLGVQGFFNVT